MTKLNRSDFDFVIFDFDGILVDTNSLKTSIFKEVVRFYPPATQEHFISYHKKNNGKSRWHKFEYLLTTLAPFSDPRNLQASIEQLVSQFTTLYEKQLPSVSLIPQALQVLSFLQNLGKPCFIVSGGAENEVQAIVKSNGIQNYFQAILGSPVEKEANLAHLQKQNHLQGTGIFIGDSLTDFICAEKFSLNFIFMQRYSEWLTWQEKQTSFYLHVQDLINLETVLRSDNEVS